MKNNCLRFFCLSLFAMLMVQMDAWILPTNQVKDGENFSISVNVDDLESKGSKLGNVSDLYAKATSLLPMRLWIRSGTSMHPMLLIKNKGIKGLMVGTTGSSAGGSLYAPIISVEGSDINPGYRPIYKIELSYYKLDPNENQPLCDPNVAKFSELSAAPVNGIYTYKGVIEPYLPVTHIMLGSSFDKLKKNVDNIVTETYPDPDETQKAWAAGYVITSIKVISDYGSTSYLNVRRELGAKEALGQILLSSNTTAPQQYKQLEGADLNGDNQVNAADVVTLYNIIIEGKPNTIQGHEYVDLELPSGTLWATCNVGSLVPEGYGDYLSWLENKTSLLKGKTQFYRETYSPSYPVNSISENQTVASRYFATGSGTLNIYSDWSQWEVPSKADWEELLQNANLSLINQHGVEGYLFTSPKNKKSIFIPCAGFFGPEGYMQTSDDRTRLDYWSSTFSYLNSDDMPLVHTLGVDIEPCMMQMPAYYGAPMRMVHRKIAND